MNAAEVNALRLETIELLKGQRAKLADALECEQGVMRGQGFVVRTSPGLYLTPKGDGYGVCSLLMGVVMWSKCDAEIQARHTRMHGGDGAADATAVHYRDALRTEITALTELIAHVEALRAA